MQKRKTKSIDENFIQHSSSIFFKFSSSSFENTTFNLNKLITQIITMESSSRPVA